MKFLPDVHTKSYLLNNPSVLADLAAYSNEFGISSLADDIDILSFSNWSLSKVKTANVEKFLNEGFCVAHVFAIEQPNWLSKDSSKDINVLSLTDMNGWSVAHMLAEHQNQWALSPEGKRLDILSISRNKITVAQLTAKYNHEWITKLSSDDLPILLIRDEKNPNSQNLLQWINDNGLFDFIRYDLFTNKEFLLTPLYHGEPVIFTALIGADTKETSLRWSNSELAQDYEIIKYNLPSNNTPAHFLASTQKSDWYLSPAASDPSVFEMTNLFGISVGHNLIKNFGDKAPKILWSNDYAHKLYNGSCYQNFTLCHALALHSPEWCERSENAFSKKVLTSVCSIRLTRSKEWEHKSLVEMMDSIPLEEKVFRLISQGAAFKINEIYDKKQSTKINLDCAERIYDILNLIVYEQSDDAVKVKILLAGYSTFKHFETAERLYVPKTNFTSSFEIEEQRKREECWSVFREKCRELITVEIAKKPELLEDISIFSDFNMEPADDLLAQFISEKIFSSTDIFSEIDQHNDANQESCSSKILF